MTNSHFDFDRLIHTNRGKKRNFLYFLSFALNILSNYYSYLAEKPSLSFQKNIVVFFEKVYDVFLKTL